jgi:hypothetical protein
MESMVFPSAVTGVSGLGRQASLGPAAGRGSANARSRACSRTSSGGRWRARTRSLFASLLGTGIAVARDMLARLPCGVLVLLARTGAGRGARPALESRRLVRVPLGATVATDGAALHEPMRAAGLRSAGFVMSPTILSTLDPSLEGAAPLVTIDGPLDVLRTVVDVSSGTREAAVMARGEGESGPRALGREPVEGSGREG